MRLLTIQIKLHDVYAISINLSEKEKYIMDLIRRHFEESSYEDYEITEYEGHLEAKSDLAIFMVVEPHEGTKNRWMLRASTVSGFDRWANSTAVEMFFQSEEDVNYYLMKHDTEIYYELLRYLSETYDELERDIEY